MIHHRSAVSGPMKAVIYVGLAGTLIVGIYPQPVIDWVVAATMMFSDLGGQTAGCRILTSGRLLRATDLFLLLHLVSQSSEILLAGLDRPE